MEEYIKILEEIVETYRSCSVNEEGFDMKVDIGFTKKECEALENLIAGYKQLEEENKELKHITQNYNAYQQKSDNPNSTIIIADEKWFINGYFKENFIPKSKVKEKIEELKKKVEELTDDKGYWGGSDLLEQIKVLQELLREE